MSVTYRCKMCGGDVERKQGETIGTCDSCGTRQTLPKTGDEKVSNLFNRANNLRLKCEFDRAEKLYEKIVETNDGESEAHWGLVLCRYGIEYVEDPKTFKRVPTCHRTLYEPIVSDPDYQAAIDYSDAVKLEEVKVKIETSISHNDKNKLNHNKTQNTSQIFFDSEDI